MAACLHHIVYAVYLYMNESIKSWLPQNRNYSSRTMCHVVAM